MHGADSLRAWAMTRRNAIVALLLAFSGFAALSLFRGAPYLERALAGGLPLGNLLFALGLCALAGASVTLSAPGSGVRRAALLSLAAAVLWLPASVVLAGNLDLNFSGDRGAAWFALSVAVVVGTCAILGWALGARLSRSARLWRRRI